ncbi:hypothetical protein KQI48_00675 [Cellulomonas hominis]|uniref:hypothetical protein n=1 Tax=Cellulomonas hominis TaxID=156981 RepID=UPI0019A4DCBB|nr:hypothetical protein [Cellulomonas hominis]MBD3777721.1 hypothetical protein [Micrococcales bacterium]MBU5421168.1 hypothetical protein [Cellulomonas hominis]
MTSQLLIWTDPRDVVVWAASAEDAAGVRAVLEAAGCSWWPVTIYGVPREAATSLDISLDAMACLHALTAAGYTFAWHPSQQPAADRQPQLYGFDVVDVAEHAPGVEEGSARS